MLIIHFVPAVIGAINTFGPIPYFAIEGKDLTAGPDESVFAEHLNYQWRFRKAFYTTIHVKSSIHINFDDGQAEGPFQEIQFIDGHARVGEGFGRSLGHYDVKSNTWFVQDTKKHHRRVTVRPA